MSLNSDSSLSFLETNITAIKAITNIENVMINSIAHIGNGSVKKNSFHKNIISIDYILIILS